MTALPTCPNSIDIGVVRVKDWVIGGHRDVAHVCNGTGGTGGAMDIAVNSPFDR